MTRPTWIVCALAAAVAAAPALAQGQQTAPQQQPPAQQKPAQQQPAQQQPAQQQPAQGQAQPAPAPAAPAADRLYVDEDYNFRLASPSGWPRTNPAALALPGEVIRAWSPDGTAWVAIYRLVPPSGPVSPRGMTTHNADALKNSLGAEIAVQEVRDLAGMKAMWVIANGKGTGSALDGKGTVPTSQHWVAVPRSDDVLVFLLTAPQSAFGQVDRVFEDMLRTLQVGGTQTEGQRAGS
jgi:hypothetical protein